MSKNPTTKAQLERAAQDRIGRQLRTMYSALVRQPLPEKLLATLRAIDDATEKGSSQSDEPLRHAA
jgi:Anti-sigma factor NepR